MTSELVGNLTKQLARVEDCYMEIEDHGILTCWLSLHKEEGFHQSFGGCSLDGYDENLKRRIGSASGMDWVLRLLQIFSVSRLEEIKGKMCYALYENDSELIKGIKTLDIDGGHEFLISDWRKQWGISDD